MARPLPVDQIKAATRQLKKEQKEALAQYLTDELGVNFLAEQKVYPDRKWRVDFYAPCVKVALEIEGGVYTRGRHTRPIGFINDMEKYNYMSSFGLLLIHYIMGWVVGTL